MADLGFKPSTWSEDSQSSYARFAAVYGYPVASAPPTVRPCMVNTYSAASMGPGSGPTGTMDHRRAQPGPAGTPLAMVDFKEGYRPGSPCPSCAQVHVGMPLVAATAGTANGFPSPAAFCQLGGSDSHWDAFLIDTARASLGDVGDFTAGPS